MPALKLEQLSNEVMELTSQPELAVIERRAGHRRARRWVTSAAWVVILPVVGVLLWAVVPTGHPANVVATPPADPSGGPVGWADAGDATHLYATLNKCPACDARLVGSDDGGRTWTVRQETLFPEVFDLDVRGARTLLAPEVHEKAPVQGHAARISTDGGRTWADLTTSGTPATKVPAGGWLRCSDAGVRPGTTSSLLGACTLQVLDPAGRTIRPLATPPPGIATGVAEAPAAAGLWVTGFDGSGVPSVSVSRDGGVTWSVHSFPPPVRSSSGEVRVSTPDGRAVCAMVGVADGYRSMDGGRTWQPIDVNDALSADGADLAPALMLPDGTHVRQRQTASGFHVLFSPVGARAYVEGSRPAWPGLAVHMADDGSYTAHDSRALYRSTDGTNWTRITPQG
jgi:hypothetical protein